MGSGRDLFPVNHWYATGIDLSGFCLISGFQSSIDALGRLAQDFKSGESFVVGGNEIPGGECIVRERQHVAHGGFVGRPLSAIAPVFVVDFVMLVRRLFARAETGELFVFGNLQPVFHHNSAVIGELLFEVVDLGKGSFPLPRVTKSFNSLH